MEELGDARIAKFVAVFVVRVATGALKIGVGKDLSDGTGALLVATGT